MASRGDVLAPKTMTSGKDTFYVVGKFESNAPSVFPCHLCRTPVTHTFGNHSAYPAAEGNPEVYREIIREVITEADLLNDIDAEFRAFLGL